MARFSKDNQPIKRSPRGKAKQPGLELIKKAQPQIIQAVIDKALEGDMQAAGILLKRVAPELKPITDPSSIDAELLRAKIFEVSEMKNRIEALEAQANEQS